MRAPMSSDVIVDAASSTACDVPASTWALWRAQADEVQTKTRTSGATPRNQWDDRIEPPDLVTRMPRSLSIRREDSRLGKPVRALRLDDRLLDERREGGRHRDPLDVRALDLGGQPHRRAAAHRMPDGVGDDQRAQEARLEPVEESEV